MTRKPKAGRGVLAAVALVVAALALAVPVTPRPAAAAAAPPPALVPIDLLIPLLKPLAPALEIISPIVWPQCANATLVSVLPGALGIAVPPELSLVTGPLLVLCGAVPQPGTNGRKCAIDAKLYDQVAVLTKPVLGSGPPVEIAPAKWVTGLLDNIVDTANLAAVPIGSTVAGVLQCIDPSTQTTTTVVSSATTPTTSGGLPLEVALNLPTFEDLQTLPALDSALTAPPVTQIVAAPRVRFINQPRFRYPVVMGLPLLFIALLVFFGRALTRPIDLEDKR